MNMNCLNCGHSYSLPTGEPFKGRSVEIYDRLGGSYQCAAHTKEENGI